MKLLFIPYFFSFSLKFCEYNIDCPLPQICCDNGLFKYCCHLKDLTLKPIYQKK